VEIHPLGPARFGDAADLFESNSTTRGCWCVWFLMPVREAQAGWGEDNRRRFEELAQQDNPPAGLLAYEDSTPVGWCAIGPRTRYPQVAKSRLMVHRDPAEDPSVWFVPCFFVRVGSRRSGITKHLLDAAIEQAVGFGARAIEGFPLAGDGPHKANRYLGTERLFTACGFSAIARPSPQRVVMRRELSS
jgi:GNAT superfamily N-acetyltransferase